MDFAASPSDAKHAVLRETFGFDSFQPGQEAVMNSRPSYRGYRFPPEIISHAVWLYHRFTLSLRDIEDLLAERNVIVSYESIRQWCATFGLDYARRVRKRLRCRW